MGTAPSLVDSGIDLQPDRTRTIARFFLPGREDVGPGHSRAIPVIQRIMDLPEDEVESAIRDVETRFGGRHPDLHALFAEHAAMVATRVETDVPMSASRAAFLGACFTHEYSIEGAALCNPSAVPLTGARHGGVSFVLSVRGIGEGHRSSIGFRTGFVTDAGVVTLDPAGPFPHTAANSEGVHHRSVFHSKLAELDDDRENASFVLDPLAGQFDTAELDLQIQDLIDDKAGRRNTAATVDNMRRLSASSYRATFPSGRELSERVLWPHAPAEHHGMEDARFVRFTDADGSQCYLATYTAFDGVHISQHLLETDDFQTFVVSPMAGAAATGKGLALFPRRIGGRFAALSRSDRETNSVTFSDDLHCWEESTIIQSPTRAWEVLQLGNCGSPIETAEGWLVLTHGVGPMRTYAIGAILLDLHDPRVVLASSGSPILTPGDGRRDAYVPNVVYTCGGFAHADTLVLPYGVADQSIAIATTSLTALLASLEPTR